MTYKRFEDLPVWKDSIRLAEECEDFLLSAKNHITFSKRDQLDRCSLSVSNNIAEGFERGTTNELLAFLCIARGSAGEARSMLIYFSRRPALKDFKSEISNLRQLAESCSRQIRAWADSLQNSDIKGQRHLNQESKANWDKRQTNNEGAKSFAETEKQVISQMPANHPARLEWERRNGPLT